MQSARARHGLYHKRLRWMRPRRRPSFRMTINQLRVEVFDQDDFILRLVVEQLVSYGADHQQAEAARAQAFSLAFLDVQPGCIGRVFERSVLQALEVEAGAGISDAVEKH